MAILGTCLLNDFWKQSIVIWYFREKKWIYFLRWHLSAARPGSSWLTVCSQFPLLVSTLPAAWMLFSKLHLPTNPPCKWGWELGWIPAAWASRNKMLLGRIFIDKIQNVYNSFPFSIFFYHTHGLILVLILFSVFNAFSWCVSLKEKMKS